MEQNLLQTLGFQQTPVNNQGRATVGLRCFTPTHSPLLRPGASLETLSKLKYKPDPLLVHLSHSPAPQPPHPLFPPHPSYKPPPPSKPSLSLPASHAKFPICQFNSLIDGKEQEKNGPAQLASQVSPGRIPPAPLETAERNVCEAQRTQVNSNLAGLGASTFPARTASSRERGSARTLRVSPPSSQIFPPGEARRDGVAAATVAPCRASEGRKKGDGAVGRPCVGCGYGMAGMQGLHWGSGCDPRALPPTQGADPDLPLGWQFSRRALGALCRCFGGAKIFSLLVSKMPVILVFQREGSRSPNEGRAVTGGGVHASLAALM